jgi:hypothetical protein
LTKWVSLVYSGCKDQERGACINLVWWSSLSNELHGVCSGTFLCVHLWDIASNTVFYCVWFLQFDLTSAFWCLMHLQKHIDTNADITVSCVPMDDRYL